VADRLQILLADLSFSSAEAQTITRFIELLSDALGSDLRAVWLYGSCARRERGPESDIDLLVIAEGDLTRNRRAASDLSEVAALAFDENPFLYSVQLYDTTWLEGRREIESFFVAEVDRDKVVLAGGPLDQG
jgi:predicted nucleotidyltransferase